jgi:hypothetical protein
LYGWLGPIDVSGHVMIAVVQLDAAFGDLLYL